MKNWENWLYYLASAGMAALGVFFIVLGAIFFMGSGTSLLVGLRKRTGYKFI